MIAQLFKNNMRRIAKVKIITNLYTKIKQNLTTQLALY
jgi:hypothetical protein